MSTIRPNNSRKKIYLSTPVLDTGGILEPGEKPAEATMDWKPNSRTAPGPGIEPGLSGAQCGRRTVTPFAFPNVNTIV